MGVFEVLGGILGRDEVAWGHTQTSNASTGFQTGGGLNFSESTAVGNDILCSCNGPTHGVTRLPVRLHHDPPMMPCIFQTLRNIIAGSRTSLVSKGGGVVGAGASGAMRASASSVSGGKGALSAAPGQVFRPSPVYVLEG